ncbi:hypothetical protein TSH100_15315 [Azospirillum sp. TSH100]|uniref:HlyD family type I secretion periplasmic adaptor subunit n=1 Tax=Azospirillum sp. TSH100 TaxID=652764 RepID=UPI000D61E5D9|nr:HlyD family type I secretion periplasmic adaptor subunit [Azospirillum sp. TSH100]PWC85516.1 hypothetical protein TSH100_15315 [Azospirillum sp. TSH100]
MDSGFDPNPFAIPAAGAGDWRGPLMRLATFAGVLFAVSGLLLLTPVDIVVTAAGQITPTAKPAAVQAPYPGFIKTVAVREGDHVQAGALMFQLDDTEQRSAVERLSARLRVLSLQELRLRSQIDDGETMILPPTLSPDEPDVEIEQRLLTSEVRHFTARCAEGEANIATAKAEIEVLKASKAQAEAILVPVQELYNRQKYLTARGTGPIFSELNLAEQLAQRRHDVSILSARIAQELASIEKAAKQLEVFRTDYRKQLMQQLKDTVREIVDVRSEIVVHEEAVRRARIVAQVSGVVHRLAAGMPGAVVDTGDELAQLTPDDYQAEVEVYVSNRDAAFIRPGQTAVVSLDALRHAMDGRFATSVRFISPDVQRQAGEEASYPVRLLLPERSLVMDGTPVDLSAGMRVTADIITGQRHLAEFLISPLVSMRMQLLTQR